MLPGMRPRRHATLPPLSEVVFPPPVVSWPDRQIFTLSVVRAAGASLTRLPVASCAALLSKLSVRPAATRCAADRYPRACPVFLCGQHSVVDLPCLRPDNKTVLGRTTQWVHPGLMSVPRERQRGHHLAPSHCAVVASKPPFRSSVLFCTKHLHRSNACRSTALRAGTDADVADGAVPLLT